MLDTDVCVSNTDDGQDRLSSRVPDPLRGTQTPTILNPNRKVDVRLLGEGNSHSHGAKTVHQIISMIKWIRTSRLSIKKSLSVRHTRISVKHTHIGISHTCISVRHTHIGVRHTCISVRNSRTSEFSTAKSTASERRWNNLNCSNHFHPIAKASIWP